MNQPEPTREWQDSQHQEVLQADPIAFAELCEFALAHLVSFLRAQFPNQENHTHEMAAIDCLLDYQKKPQRYDPQRLPLFAYLRMAARRDMLNAIDKHRRRDQRLSSLEDPLTHQKLASDGVVKDSLAVDDWVQQYTDLTREEIIQALDAELDNRDKQILLLMLDGVRETPRYAEVMGITYQAEADQRREVKRAKDRLNKKLRRFGKRLDHE